MALRRLVSNRWTSLRTCGSVPTAFGRRLRPTSALLASVRANSSEATGGAVPVVLLAGFLGAGKTTLLEHLLTGDHGLKLAVIVNDLASVNVDANVLDSAIARSGAKSVELSNGCVCCTAKDDLHDSVLELLRPPSGGSTAVQALEGNILVKLDAVVVELSGVAELSAVCDTLSFLPQEAAYVARKVTVVDTPAFAAELMAEPRSAIGATGLGEEQEQLSTLLAEQLEGADLVLLNKADMATEKEMDQAKAVVKALNATAEMAVVEHSKISANKVLPLDSSWLPNRRLEPTEAAAAGQVANERHHAHGSHNAHDSHSSRSAHESHSSHHAHDSQHACESHDGHGHTHTHSHGEAIVTPEQRYGLRSFVFSSSRPFSRKRFVMQLQKWQKEWAKHGKELRLEEEDADIGKATEVLTSGREEGSIFAPVLRSKGILWMDSQPRDALYWSHAGKCARFSLWGRWALADLAVSGFIAPDEGSKAGAPNATSGWAAAALGKPRLELVFIGKGMDEDAMRKVLNECVLSEAELAALPPLRSARSARGGA